MINLEQMTVEYETNDYRRLLNYADNHCKQYYNELMLLQ